MDRKNRNRNRNAARPETGRDSVTLEPVVESVVAAPVVAESVVAESHHVEVTSQQNTASTENTASNDLLHRMADQIADLHRMITTSQTNASQTDQSNANSCGIDNETLTELRVEVDELALILHAAQAKNEDLRQQNDDLATRLAATKVRSAVSSPQSSVNDALTWAERKALILAQMEQDDFDANAFVADLQNERSGQAIENAEIESPSQFVDSLHQQLIQSDDDVRERDDEIVELKILLQQRGESRSGDIAFGASAIAELVDADELVLQERQRLQLLQAEWEEKFRRSEIEASLERAKLSRERQQLANKTAELEEQIEHLRREARQSEETGNPNSRRWLVKLGLADKE